MRRLGPAIVLVLAGCGPENGEGGDPDATGSPSSTELSSTDSAPTSSTAASTGLPDPPDPPEPPEPFEECPDHTLTDACCCFHDDRGTSSVCGVTDLCPTMEFVCEAFAAYECASADLTTTDESAIVCALQALAAGQPGRVSWYIDGYGYTHEDVQLDLAGDATVFRQGGYHIDLCNQVYDVERLPLKEAAHFDGCLGLADWRARFDCLRDGLEVAPLATCLVGYSWSPEFTAPGGAPRYAPAC